MTRLLIALPIAILLSSCATVERLHDNFEDADITESSFVQAWARAERQNADERAQRYIGQWSTDAMWATDRPQRYLPEWPWSRAPFYQAVSGCVTAIFPAVESASIVLRVDFAGYVVHSITDQTGYIEECVARKTRGLRVQPPPTSGFLLCQRYTRQPDDKYKLEGCGPQHWQTVCKQTGTMRSCQSRFGG